MAGQYFKQIAQKTPTEFWINNADPEQARRAMECGAIGATTNPTYLTRLSNQTELLEQLEQGFEKRGDFGTAMQHATCWAVGQLCEIFLPLYEKSKGRYGYVAIQGNPRRNHEADFIIEEGLQLAALSKNIIVKVPATPAGAKAMIEFTKRGIPTIATLGFSVAQAIFMAETYQRAATESGKSPLCYLTVIAGILDEYLMKQVKEQKLSLNAEALAIAGCEATRVAYTILNERGFKARLMGGGAREPYHFSELAGGDLAITIGWNIAEKLLNQAPEERMASHAPSATIQSLLTQLPDFRKAYEAKALQPNDFVAFGPVASFQQSFLQAYDKLEAQLKERRTVNAR